jgi:hypothetical protein
MWCYAGVLLVLMALGWAGYGSLLKDCWESYEVPWQAIGLFMAGFVMMAVNVLQSLVGALCGFCRGDFFPSPSLFVERRA